MIEMKNHQGRATCLLLWHGLWYSYTYTYVKIHYGSFDGLTKGYQDNAKPVIEESEEILVHSTWRQKNSQHNV